MAVDGARRGLPPPGFAILSSQLLQNIPEGRYMGDRRTLLLIDDDPAHVKVFREALVEARDGPFEGKWVGRRDSATRA